MLRSKLSSLREYLTPINHKSNFSTTGEISPEEFVEAGDYLVYKFPTWRWSSCPKSLQKSFLPEDKQFLITKHVPSHQRASTYLSGGSDNADLLEEEEEIEGEEGEDGWVKSRKVVTSAAKPEANLEGSQEVEEDELEEAVEVTDIDELIDVTAEGGAGEDNDEEQEEDFDDLDIVNDSTNKLRKYDMYITYSTSYRVPKMYLVGFDSNGIPLLPKQMFEDINSDYVDKTATIENLPVAHNTTSVSIHPCRHASVMKILMKHSKLKKESDTLNERLRTLTVDDQSEQVQDAEETVGEPGEDGEVQGIRVDQYLIIFLKFIASVTPGIVYDYTMDAL
ncbi:Autophagy-related protein 3 [Spathaspora sp. JA1]|nr:Autophagy-related protein 3 [Spathaspora sp. JA1]